MDAIGEPRDEHAVLLEEAHDVRRALASGDRPAAVAHLATLVGHLTRHVAREERGVFTSLREQGDFAGRVLGLFDELEQHIEREDLGIFPVSVVTLGATGWATVERAHRDLPTFLTARATT